MSATILTCKIVCWVYSQEMKGLEAMCSYLVFFSRKHKRTQDRKLGRSLWEREMPTCTANPRSIFYFTLSHTIACFDTMWMVENERLEGRCEWDERERRWSSREWERDWERKRGCRSNVIKEERLGFLDFTLYTTCKTNGPMRFGPGLND